MRKLINVFKVLSVATIISLSMSTLSFAGQWKQNNIGWWYENDNKSYPVNTWAWLDGNKDGIAECYYFDNNGYCLMNTTTPDNYTVNENGAWTVNGVVQIKSYVEDMDIEENENVSDTMGNQNTAYTPSNNQNDDSDFHPSQGLLDMVEEEAGWDGFDVGF